MCHEIQAAMGNIDSNSELVTQNPSCESISHLPLLKNEDQISDHIASVFSHVFGEENFTYPVPGSEDFAVLARSPASKGEAHIPYYYWRHA